VRVLVANRITAGGRRASSRPLVVETSQGLLLVKLRGAAQGTGPLVAEIVVAELAERLGIPVPPRSLIELPAKLETADWDDELEDLLTASVGLNLGFEFFVNARDATAADVARLDRTFRTVVLWLDRFVMNPDRTRRNPNLLCSPDRVWLIDHGASLRFQYSWDRVSEKSPRDAGLAREPHLFETSVPQLTEVDNQLASRLSRHALEQAVAAVPDSFLLPMLDARGIAVTGLEESLRRRRAAYVAFLWKRLKHPRPFLEPQRSSA
jgi:hypothetical protein